MKKHGKKYRAALEKIESGHKYNLDTAIAKVKEISFAKFDETVELTVWLGVDPRKADQLVRGTIVLPHGLGKSKTVLVIAQGDKVREADGFIICTPEYNHGYPAVLKNALDYTYASWARKAVAFVSWGGAGGARGVEQLRLVAVELDMTPLRWAVHIPNHWTITEVSQIAEQHDKAGQILLDHLTWWTRSLKNARQG